MSAAHINEIDNWVTVIVAARHVGRKRRQMLNWIYGGKVVAAKRDNGYLVYLPSAVEYRESMATKKPSATGQSSP